jgi:bifunctional non-homologous end joining protein LigD
MLRAAAENRLEGIIAKKLDSMYEPGKRSGAWLKIKPVNRQELVIGGWIPEKGSVARGVGALLVGYYDESRGLVFAGKVGTGFTEQSRQDLKKRLEEIARDSSPFTSAPYKNAIYVEPKLIAEIEFREWTSAGSLRHPSFKGLREDKEPGTVVREDWKLS